MTTICGFGDNFLELDYNVIDEAARRLGCDYENFAAKDTSNQKIQNEVTKRAIQFSKEDVIFIIGWTHPNRYDMLHDNQYFTYRENSTNYPSIITNKLHKYDNYLFDPLLISQKWASQIFGLQNLLESKSIKYFMFNTQVPVPFNRYTEKTIRAINHTTYYDCIGEKSTFLAAETPDKFSKFLSRKIRQLGYIEKP